MLTPLVSKFGPDLFPGLKDIAEKQVPAKPKPIVGYFDLQYIIVPTNQRLEIFT